MTRFAFQKAWRMVWSKAGLGSGSHGRWKSEETAGPALRAEGQVEAELKGSQDLEENQSLVTTKPLGDIWIELEMCGSLSRMGSWVGGAHRFRRFNRVLKILIQRLGIVGEA